jgi:rubrerythrin
MRLLSLKAYTKYRYFAKLPEEGHEEIAKHFEHTADQRFYMHGVI